MTLTLADLSTLLTDVATLLGPGWHHEPKPVFGTVVYLHGPDHAEIYVRADKYDVPGKLRIGAIYPDGDEHGKSVSIGVGETRGAAVIAREITRRVLPDYLPELARVLAANDRAEAHRARRETVTSELAVLIGGMRRGRDLDGTVCRYGDPISIEIRVDRNGGGGKIEASGLSVDELRTVAALLMTFTGKARP